MKTFLVLILIALASYLAYEYLIKDEPVLEVKADKVLSSSYSMDINAPALAPAHYASVQGTVKNISDRILLNIVLKYKLDAQPVEARIDQLDPGEQRNFSTGSIRIRNTEAPFYLEEMIYE